MTRDTRIALFLMRELVAALRANDPDAFRGLLSKGMHAANVPIANICEAMGHTIEVHLKSYARFKPNATADIIAAVNV